jgi:acyl-CoA thioesterase
MTDDQLKKLIGEAVKLPYHQFMDFRIESCGGGECEIRIDIHPNILNVFRTVHGGIHYSMCDVVAFLAACTLLDGDSLAVTSDINVSVLSFVTSGTLIYTAKVLKLGKRIGFIESRVHDGKGNLIAVARITKTIISPHPKMKELLERP